MFTIWMIKTSFVKKENSYEERFLLHYATVLIIGISTDSKSDGLSGLNPGKYRLSAFEYRVSNIDVIHHSSSAGSCESVQIPLITPYML